MQTYNIIIIVVAFVSSRLHAEKVLPGIHYRKCYLRTSVLCKHLKLLVFEQIHKKKHKIFYYLLCSKIRTKKKTTANKTETMAREKQLNKRIMLLKWEKNVTVYRIDAHNERTLLRFIAWENDYCINIVGI